MKPRSESARCRLAPLASGPWTSDYAQRTALHVPHSTRHSPPAATATVGVPQATGDKLQAPVDHAPCTMD